MTTIDGTTGDDLLDGSPGADIINGYGGADILEGNGGVDEIYGGSGFDQIVYRNGTDAFPGELIYGGNGKDTILLYNRGVYDFTAAGIKSIEILTFRENGENSDADVIFSSASLNGSNRIASDLLITGTTSTASDDRIIVEMAGSADNIDISGWIFRDWTFGVDQEDDNVEVRGSGHINIITTGLSVDIVYGNGGNDVLTLGSHNDEGYGGTGADTILGERGYDLLYGGAGADTIFGGRENDEIYGGTGDDDLTGDAGNDTLHGENGADTLIGNSGSDNLFGGAGNDRLVGGFLNDRLNGGGGDDVLKGGLRSDVFVYSGSANEGSDRIADFENGLDRIEIGGNVVFANITITASGSDTILSWKNTTVLIEDVTSNLITAADFDFV